MLSDFIYLLLGVPCGSVLEPVLSFVDIIDLPSACEIPRSFLLADDTIFFHRKNRNESFLFRKGFRNYSSMVICQLTCSKY